MKKYLRLVLSGLAILLLPDLTFAATDKSLESCRSKLKAAKKLDLLYDLNWETGKTPKVIVGPTYSTLPFDVRESFALTVNCFLMAGDTHKFINFPLLDYRTHEVINYFSYGHLTQP